ncbi:T9SS type A sorting domain-containing protein [Ferruginibacter sp. HRS2-29]|uniref:T9SS type A sorting domain-containing protein n=1 Tax=Ferruginibacter sp. HRS2-29 TaxID=2487334 RepID=UPI0020CEFBDC|nr:T9SS type A sorting domain-containing protein [Ferruginibacter sp. HRS2-29]
MKKTILLSIGFLIAITLAKAQTWTGSISTAWNVADNWSPSGIPAATANVTIPGSLTNYPRLNAAVTVNTLTMQAGSKLDVNGFPFSIETVNGYTSVVGATISNSDATKDVVFNVNTGINGYNATFSRDTLTDNVIFNVSGQNNFLEGAEPNKYMFDATFNLANSGTSYISYQGGGSLFSGNLTISRTAAGNTDIFSGGGTVTGNFVYNNTTGGNSTIGNQGNIVSNIAGTVNMNVALPSASSFLLHRIKNQTTGGTISVKNSAGFDVRFDTLKLASFIIEEYKIPYAYLFNNNFTVTGQVKISDDPAFNNGYNTTVNGNTFTGATNFFINGTNILYEANAANASNTYNGATSFSANASGGLYLGYIAGSAFNGPLTVTRSIAGETNIFGAGDSHVNGNFSYTNPAGGNTSIGRQDLGSYVTGTVNINTNNASTGLFRMYRLINQATGGTISINKAKGIDIRNDTLKQASFSVTGYLDGYTQLFNNDIAAGDISISDDITFGGGYSTNTGSNIFTGTCNFTINGTNSFFEASGSTTSGNIYNGTTNFFGAGTGQFFTGQSALSTYNGNVNISRTVASNGAYFLNGATITGNLSYTNNTGGISTTIGSLAAKTSIGGTFNLTANHPSQGRLELYRIINQTTGGTVLIQNTGETNIQKDTLKLASFTIAGYRNAYARIYDNSITGNFNFSDDASNGGGYNTTIHGNEITGATSYTLNGSNIIYDLDNERINRYNGNVSYNKVGVGTFNISTPAAANEYARDLTLNSTTGLNIYRAKFIGAANGILRQLGTQPLSLQKIIMAKSGTGGVTLNSPLTITDSLFFGVGNIYASTANMLNFADNAKHTGSNSLSHVVGPVSKTGDDAFTFPVGAASSIDSVSISAPASVTDRFSAQYFYADPTLAGYDTAQRVTALKRVSGCEYWDVQREAGTSNVSLTFGYDGACTTSGMYINNPAALRVAHWTGTTWEDLGNGGSSGTTTGTVKTAAPVSNFSPFSIASTDLLINPLPLTLISFKGFRQGVNIRLSWQTENEFNLSRYEVEKSTDGIRFKFMELVKAVNRGGIHNYSGTDETPAKGFNYYRLKQIDIDGSFTYSNVAKINFDGKLSLSISPNPVKEKMVVSEAVAGDVIRIFDVQGKLLRSYQVRSVNEPISTAGLPAGVYALQLYNNNSLQTIQFIKQ